MRFTLQHVLVFLGANLLLVVLNVTLGDGIGPGRGALISAVCLTGAYFGLSRYRANRPDVKIPPLWPVIVGMAVSVFAATVAIALLYGWHGEYCCTRTLCTRDRYDWGLISFSRTHETEQSRIVRDVLGFKPVEHHWECSNVGYSGLFGWHGHGRAGKQWPLRRVAPDALRRLALLQPVEKSHVLFQWENDLDFEFALVREWILNDVVRFCHDKNAAEGVRQWFDDYEPLLRPFRTKDDMRQAILDFRSRPKSKVYEIDMRQDLEPYLDTFAKEVGLPAQGEK